MVDWVFDTECLIDTNLYLNDLIFSETPQVCSHNAFASLAYGWDTHYMQYHDIKNQFYSGARCFMVDVYEQNGELVLIHNPSFKGFAGIGTSNSQYYDPLTFEQFLLDISILLKSHPHAVISLILENKGVTHKQIEALLIKVGLDNYLLKTDPNDPGLTFGKIRETGGRLIIFAEEGDKQPDVNIFSTKYYKESTYSLGDDKECIDRYEGRVTFNDQQTKIFVLNHFYRTSCHHPSKNVIFSAWPIEIMYNCDEVNAYDEIKERVSKCKSVHNLKPTYIAIDFIERGKDGGALKVVSDLIDNTFYPKLKKFQEVNTSSFSLSISSICYYTLFFLSGIFFCNLYYRYYKEYYSMKWFLEVVDRGRYQPSVMERAIKDHGNNFFNRKKTQ